jgi:hypothetical protein
MAGHVPTLIGDDRPFIEIWGWNSPAMNRNDLAEYIRSPIGLIQKIDATQISDEDLNKLNQIPSRIQNIRNNTINNLPGGNSFHVYIVIQSLVESLNLILNKYNVPEPFDIEVLKDRNILPAQQLRKLRTIEAGIQRLGIESVELENKVVSIKEAHEIAEALPADIQTLEDARERYEQARNELGKIRENAQASEAEIEATKTRLIEAADEAQKIIERANNAFSAATTVGLGKAFTERANALNFSTIVLAMLLVVALVVGGWITNQRVEYVHRLMERPGVDFRVLWLNVTLTALSISAPVWAAWLITRQIGQRFRLAEDYGFKASVAKAYEGYRAQAAYIDPEAQKKLFSIALERLAEAPLRLVEKDSPGSPVHEGGRGALGFLFGERRAKADKAEG